jgi:hypothetical protein
MTDVGINELNPLIIINNLCGIDQLFSYHGILWFRLGVKYVRNCLVKFSNKYF